MKLKIKKEKLPGKVVFFITRGAIILLLAVSIASFFIDKGDADISRNIFVITQTSILLLLTFTPTFIEKVFKVEIPDFIETLFLFFIVSALLLGEVANFFITVWWWDVMLHIFSGLLVAIVGFSIYVGSIKERKSKKTNHPFFVALFVFCFTVTVEISWELIEYLFDLTVANSNMLRTVDSVTLVPFSGIEAVKDTINDILLNMASAFVIAVLGFFDFKYSWNLFSKWMINPKPTDDK